MAVTMRKILLISALLSMVGLSFTLADTQSNRMEKLIARFVKDATDLKDEENDATDLKNFQENDATDLKNFQENNATDLKDVKENDATDLKDEENDATDLKNFQENDATDMKDVEENDATDLQNFQEIDATDLKDVEENNATDLKNIQEIDASDLNNFQENDATDLNNFQENDATDLKNFQENDATDLENMEENDPTARRCRPCIWVWGRWTRCQLNGYQTRRMRITYRGCNCPRVRIQRRRCYYTCRELKSQHNIRITDVYQIRLPSGAYKVYCEMGINGGGYTFISRPMIPKLTPADIAVLFRNRRDVLLRVLRPDVTEPYTVIKQYRNTAGLTVQVNGYTGQDQAPKNQGLGPYLLLGTLDRTIAAAQTTLGFLSNNIPVLYRNCHNAGRNFFAFFGNHQEAPVSNYHGGNLVYERIRVAVDWRKSAKIPYSGSRLPTDYYLFTEMHYGGCGCYTSSDRWLKAVSPALGTAIGLR